MLSLRVHPSITEIPRDAWDALVTPAGQPLLSWTFLHALEESGCAAADKGWAPAHLTLWRESQLIAAAPAYLKSHSMGEFMYNDFRWSGVASQLGVRYYPKLVLTIPFNPCTGPRALVAAGEDRAKTIAALAQGAQEVAREQGWSSVHVLFPDEQDLAHFTAAGLAPGAGVQFHWRNEGYKTFEDFLARLSSKKRTQIRRERAQAARDGTVIRTLTGGALTPEVMRFVARCYAANVERHAMWSQHHLNEAFFLAAGERFADHVEVVLCEERAKPIAAAFNLSGQTRLFGRHWGAVAERRFLHFHACLYHPVEQCIARGVTAFEPGAGGEHKWTRGFDATQVHSAHWFADPKLSEVMRRYLPREIVAVRAEIEQARALSPLKR